MTRRCLLVLLGLLTMLAGDAFAQITGTVMPVPRIQFFLDDGTPCAGCKLYHYAAGTTTDEDVFEEVTLTGSEHEQPITLDAAGRATIFLASTSYRFRLYEDDGTTLVWDQDNITAVPGASGNVDLTMTAGEAIVTGDVVYLSDGSGGGTAGRWYRTDADNTYSSSTAPMVGIAQTTLATAAVGTVRLAGRVTGLSGLTPGELYYASATAGGVTVTPPTNTRALGVSDTGTSLVLGANPGDLRLPDSDGTHHLVVRTSSNLTADRLLTVVPGDAARSLTLSGDATLNQDVSSAATPTFVDVTYTATKTANTVFAGPASGSAAVPAFRALVGADLTAARGVRVFDSDIVQAEVVNSSAETTVYSVSVPANTLAASKGFRVRLVADYLNNTGGNADITMRATLGGTQIAGHTTTSTSLATAATRRSLIFEVSIAGLSGTTQVVDAKLQVGSVNTATTSDTNNTVAMTLATVATTSITMTSTQTLAITADHDSADANKSIRVHAVFVELLE